MMRTLWIRMLVIRMLRIRMLSKDAEDNDVKKGRRRTLKTGGETAIYSRRGGD